MFHRVGRARPVTTRYHSSHPDEYSWCCAVTLSAPAGSRTLRQVGLRRCRRARLRRSSADAHQASFINMFVTCRYPSARPGPPAGRANRPVHASRTRSPIQRTATPTLTTLASHARSTVRPRTTHTDLKQSGESTPVALMSTYDAASCPRLQVRARYGRSACAAAAARACDVRSFDDAHQASFIMFVMYMCRLMMSAPALDVRWCRVGASVSRAAALSAGRRLPG